VPFWTVFLLRIRAFIARVNPAITCSYKAPSQFAEKGFSRCHSERSHRGLAPRRSEESLCAGPPHVRRNLGVGLRSLKMLRRRAMAFTRKGFGRISVSIREVKAEKHGLNGGIHE
jgi:hypothetical protein